MPRRPARTTPRPPTGDPAGRRGIHPAAEALHRQALHLLRLLRRADDAMGISAARASALSVLVFGGPSSLGALAAAEQVSAPTMTRLVQGLVRDGWVRRASDSADARQARLVATPAAVRLLHRGRDRRLEDLSRAIATLSERERRDLERAAPALARVNEALRTAARSAGGVAPSRAKRRFD